MDTPEPDSTCRINVYNGKSEDTGHEVGGDVFHRNNTSDKANAALGHFEGGPPQQELQPNHRPELSEDRDEAFADGRGPGAAGPIEASPDNRITKEPLLDSDFQRRSTGSWYSHGTVFEISGEHADKTIANRCMVVVGKVSDIVCLPLCRHTDITDRNTSFLKSRLPIMNTNRTDSAKRLPRTIEMEVVKNRDIHDDIYINCQKPYTIHHTNLDVAFLGVVTEEAFETLREVYLDAQKEMTIQTRHSPTQGGFWDSLARLLRF